MIDLLADGPTMRQTSYAIIFPVAGALLLVFGIRRRLGWRRWDRVDNDRLLTATSASEVTDTDSGIRADLSDVPQPRSRGTGLIVGGVVVLLLGVGHVLSYAAAARTSSAVEADIGQCLTNTDFTERHISAEPVDCSRSDAAVQLVSKGGGEDSCPDGSRDGDLYPVLKTEHHTVCFIWNMHEGQCYAAASTSLAPTDCTDPTANVEVAFRVDGPGGASGCPAGGESLTYHEPERSYCLVTP